jgi:DNA-binding NarL/FixJ family response regulator
MSEEKAIRVWLICDFPISAMGWRTLIADSNGKLQLCGSIRSVVDMAELKQLEPADVILYDIDGDNSIAGIQAMTSAFNIPLLVISGSKDFERTDSVIFAGASGLVDKREPTELIQKAIEKVFAGELWIDRSATVRILMSVAQKKRTRSLEHDKIASLTRKERLTIEEVTRDSKATSKVIAARMNVSEHTLRNHLASIYSKLGLSKRVELFAYARDHGLAGR